jgi:prepilin-type N-terminal cleavage/methylation domain-containing protein
MRAAADLDAPPPRGGSAVARSTVGDPSLPGAPAGRAGAGGRAGAAGRGFTLIEVLIALSLLLIGGICVLSVFTLAVVHGVERYMEGKLDLLRPEARTISQQAVDAAKGEPGNPSAPSPIRDLPLSQPGFTLGVDFAPSPNGDRGVFVARAVISYQGKELRQGRLPPMWLYRSTLDPSQLGGGRSGP